MIEKRVKDKANEVLHAILCQIEQVVSGNGDVDLLNSLTSAAQRLTYLANIEQEGN